MYDLTDAIDLHVHSAPDVYARSVDDRELVAEDAAAGMKAVLLKSHHTLTADRANLARSAAEGIAVYGGLALNRTVGGLNPVAVETAVEFGAKQIWMPTIHAAHCMAVARTDMFTAEVRRGREGITVLGADGAVSPDAKRILEIVRDAEIILGTGHLAPTESLALVETAAGMGIDRILVTHPLMAFTRFTHDQMRAATALGATLELDYLSCSPHWDEGVDPDETAAAIDAIGAAHCVLATDGGQPFNPHPPTMLSDFALAMRERGVGDGALRTMMCENPARLLGI